MVVRTPLAPAALLRWDVVKGVLPESPSRILEVGCGKGGFAALLSRHNSYLGFEPDPVSSAVAAQRVSDAPGARIRHEPLTAETKIEGEFDVVAAFEVLEHLPDDVGALRSWLRWLSDDGIVVFSVPAHSARFGCWDEMVDHQRRYDRVDLEALLAGAGLVPRKILCYGFPLTRATEWVRNAVCSRRRAQEDVGTSASGRMCQPSSAKLGWLIRLGTWPFVRMQRLFLGTELGTGWVVTAGRSR